MDLIYQELKKNESNFTNSKIDKVIEELNSNKIIKSQNEDYNNYNNELINNNLLSNNLNKNNLNLLSFKVKDIDERVLNLEIDNLDDELKLIKNNFNKINTEIDKSENFLNNFNSKQDLTNNYLTSEDSTISQTTSDDSTISQTTSDNSTINSSTIDSTTSEDIFNQNKEVNSNNIEQITIDYKNSEPSNNVERITIDYDKENNEESSNIQKIPINYDNEILEETIEEKVEEIVEEEVEEIVEEEVEEIIEEEVEEVFDKQLKGEINDELIEEIILNEDEKNIIFPKIYQPENKLIKKEKVIEKSSPIVKLSNIKFNIAVHPELLNEIKKKNKINVHILKAFSTINDSNKLNKKIITSGFGIFY